jgi:hypothetical protein
MYRLRNYGNSRNLPYGKNGVFIAGQSFIDTNDQKMAQALRLMPNIGFEVLEPIKSNVKGKVK